MSKELPILMSTPMVQAILDGTKTQTRRIIKPQPIVDEDSSYVFSGHDSAKTSAFDIHDWKNPFIGKYCKYKAGDILYVRESWKMVGWDWEDGETRFRYADGTEITMPWDDDRQDKHGYVDKAMEWTVKQFEKLVDKGNYVPVSEDSEDMEWTDKPHPFSPSIHLPKWGSRIWLEVTDVRIERVQDITEADAIAEGAIDTLKYDEMKLLTGLGDWKIPSPFRPHQFGFLSVWCTINGCESWLSNPWVWVISFKVLSTDCKPEDI